MADSGNPAVGNETPGEPDRHATRVTIGWIVLVIFLLAAYLAVPFFLKFGACPADTFRTLSLDGTDFVGLGVILSALSLLALWRAVATNMGRSASWNQGSNSAFVRSSATASICVSLAGVVIGSVLIDNGVNYFFCLTPTRIIVRSGIFTQPVNATWSDVSIVSAWCETERLRAASPAYQYSMLKLVLRDGKSLVVPLGSDGQVRFDDRDAIERALLGQDYRFYVNDTVTPSTCPSGLFEYLWNWRRN
jgi:hypothetical protein